MKTLSLYVAALLGLAQGVFLDPSIHLLMSTSHTDSPLSATVDVQVVYVGVNPATNEIAFEYFPDRITAQPGSMVQFQFHAAAHTLTQSNFDNPSIPIANHQTDTGAPLPPGIFSGAMDVAAAKAQGFLPTFTVLINDTKPIWLYCTTGPHCSKGMNMVINEK